ncbi:hypothetical protein WK91_18500 [Burkholderia cepacia]|nr:hypothetical protein WK91_18500 [Burkholderia cepacia]
MLFGCDAFSLDTRGLCFCFAFAAFFGFNCLTRFPLDALTFCIGCIDFGLLTGQFGALLGQSRLFGFTLPAQFGFRCCTLCCHPGLVLCLLLAHCFRSTFGCGSLLAFGSLACFTVPLLLLRPSYCGNSLALFGLGTFFFQPDAFFSKSRGFGFPFFCRFLKFAKMRDSLRACAHRLFGKFAKLRFRDNRFGKAIGSRLQFR